MAGTPFMGVPILLLVALQVVPVGKLWAQVPGTIGHEHLTEVACVDVPPGEDSGWRYQGSGRRNHDGAIEYSNGTAHQWQDAQACVRPGHP